MSVQSITLPGTSPGQGSWQVSGQSSPAPREPHVSAQIPASWQLPHLGVWPLSVQQFARVMQTNDLTLNPSPGHGQFELFTWFLRCPQQDCAALVNVPSVGSPPFPAALSVPWVTPSSLGHLTDKTPAATSLPQVLLWSEPNPEPLGS